MRKCVYCGKFISAQELADGKAISRWTPDTAYSTEEIVFYHLDCDLKAAYDTWEKVRPKLKDHLNDVVVTKVPLKK